jgi:hypothetical protein
MKGRAGVLAPGRSDRVRAKTDPEDFGPSLGADDTFEQRRSGYGLCLWILQANGTHLILWNLGDWVQREILREHIGR